MTGQVDNTLENWVFCPSELICVPFADYVPGSTSYQTFYRARKWPVSVTKKWVKISPNDHGFVVTQHFFETWDGYVIYLEKAGLCWIEWYKLRRPDSNTLVVAPLASLLDK